MGSDPSKQTPEELVKSTTSFLHEDFMLIGKTHIKSWHAWLVIGLVAGAAAGIALVANRSGEVEKTKASGVAEVSLPSNIELYIPPHLPEALRHPQRIFSGRKLVIKNASPFKNSSASLAGQNVGPLVLKTEKEGNGLIVEIPPGVPTGSYQLSYTLDGVSQTFPLAIHGLTLQEVQGAQTGGASSVPSDPAIVYRTKICDSCYAEMVFAGDPNDPKKLYHTNSDLFSRSSDGGRTWITTDTNNLVDYPHPHMDRASDPKILVSKDGVLFFVDDVQRCFDGGNFFCQLFGIGGMLLQGGIQGKFAFSFVKEPAAPGVAFFDYGKIAYNPSDGSIYITAYTWVQEIQGWRPSIFVSHDRGKTFREYRLQTLQLGIDAITLGPDKTLYGISPERNYSISRFRSVEPPVLDMFPTPARPYPIARFSTKSDRAWLIIGGEMIVADASPSGSHSGRLYLIWQEPEKIIQDPSFEYGAYGYNFDIFVSYSDNRGETWSVPARVNDDGGKGDQLFPSAMVDKNGMLHVAFVDHRDNQDQAVFDVYYTNSRDGKTFSKNIRVTDVPTSNNPSYFRALGDYLDMVMGYPKRAYVAYPCGQSPTGPTAACMAQLNIRHRKVEDASVGGETNAGGVPDE